MRLGATLSKSPSQRLAATVQAAWPRVKAREPPHTEVRGVTKHVVASPLGNHRGIVTVGDFPAGSTDGIRLPRRELRGSCIDLCCQASLQEGLAVQALQDTRAPLSEATLAWTGGLLGYNPAHVYPRPGELHCQASGTPRRPTDYELSLGKIMDTLQNDYPAFFERLPNFEIYDDSIVLELGRPFHAVSALHGKRKYRGAIAALQRLGITAVRGGMVRCRIADGTQYGHAVKVAWECSGTMVGFCPVHISAISLYSVTPQVPSLDGKPELECSPALSHRVHRHAIEFVEIQPPSLRSLLLRSWWQRQTQVEPVFAMGQRL